MASLPAPDPRARVWALLAWLLCSIVMLWLFRSDFGTLGFRDPDDAMRLQQVRDWIGGQAFWDVSQHRVNPPIGGPMHWSRIVDMPIAALILLTRPLLGESGATILACALVPPLLLGGLTAALFLATRRIAGAGVALLAVVLLLTAPTVLVQFTPLRIDHHGWQIWMATVALGGAMDARRTRGGIIAGLALAIWLQISSEALPYVALFAALFALRQWIERAETSRFVAFATTLGAAALGGLLLLRGWSMAMQSRCDALSAVYAWPLVALALMTPLAWRLIGGGNATRRFLLAASGGGAAIITLLATGGPCLSGDPFQALGPLAYKLWYLQVLEGRPIWEQSLSMAGVILLPVLAGLAGTLVAARAAHRPDARQRWLALALLLAGAGMVALMVMRAASVAHVFAVPGIAWLLICLFRRIQASSRAVIRIGGSVALVLLTPVGLSALWVALAAAPEPPTKSASVNCRAATTLAPLRALPPATLFAPLDLGPDILVQTRHSVIGTAHHRNAAGITAVIEGFVASPDQARRVVMALQGGKGADYVVTCTGLNEFSGYAKEGPAGLAAMLNKGQIPAWLRPLPGKGPLHIYRVVDQPGTKAIATPFMQ
ncbi:hypothetical protein PMI04_019960 [Sphingobium sp. AP49]|uniref:hypothetical protein n=1 Tax=Sphingobium sp. AP49 TaxID=1144307 RepID=UPI0005616DFC|nr:hypothetical protein [Sphingobium sp. AP49]WHO38783.1 hypothetical protein PMI04_019960 [Sphingobium sp. AP49]